MDDCLDETLGYLKDVARVVNILAARGAKIFDVIRVRELLTIFPKNPSSNDHVIKALGILVRAGFLSYGPRMVPRQYRVTRVLLDSDVQKAYETWFGKSKSDALGEDAPNHKEPAAFAVEALKTFFFSLAESPNKPPHADVHGAIQKFLKACGFSVRREYRVRQIIMPREDGTWSIRGGKLDLFAIGPHGTRIAIEYDSSRLKLRSIGKLLQANANLVFGLTWGSRDADTVARFHKVQKLILQHRASTWDKGQKRIWWGDAQKRT